MVSSALKTERFEMRAPTDLLRAVDDWRRRQSDLPSRSEAIRRLIEAGLSLQVATKSGRRAKASTEPAEKTAPRKRAPRAKPLAMSKEAQIRALRERDT